MRFRTVAIAALILVLASVAAFAAFTIAEESRSEVPQQTVERNDSLAVEPDIRQYLAPDQDHDPTAWGSNGTERVEYNGTVWQPDGNYTYYPDAGEIEFLRNETGEANISFQYDVPKDQVADEQLKTVTRGFGNIMRVGVGLAFVVLFLFIGGFAAKRIQTTNGSRGR